MYSSACQHAYTNRRRCLLRAQLGFKQALPCCADEKSVCEWQGGQRLDMAIGAVPKSTLEQMIVKRI